MRSHFSPLSRVTYRSTLPTPDGPSLATSYSIVTRRVLMTCTARSFSGVTLGSEAGGVGPTAVGEEATTPPGSLLEDGGGVRSSTALEPSEDRGGVGEVETRWRGGSPAGGTGGVSEDATGLAEPDEGAATGGKLGGSADTAVAADPETGGAGGLAPALPLPAASLVLSVDLEATVVDALAAAGTFVSAMPTLCAMSSTDSRTVTAAGLSMTACPLCSRVIGTEVQVS